MKIQNDSRIAGVFKRIFNVRQWADYDRMKTFTLYLGAGIKKLVVPQKVNVEDSKNSFNETLSTMNLTDQDLTARAKGLYRLSILMCAIAIVIFVYAGYHLVHGSYKAAIVSFVVSLIGLVLAFRYHFWYFQIKERKLGCTFKEWYWHGLLGKKL